MKKYMPNKRAVAFAVALLLVLAQFSGIIPAPLLAQKASAAVSVDINYVQSTAPGTWVSRTGTARAGANAPTVVADTDATDGYALKVPNVVNKDTPACTSWGKMADGTVEMRVKVVPTNAAENAILGLGFRISGDSSDKFCGLSMMGLQGGTVNALLAETDSGWKDPFALPATQTVAKNQYYTVKITFIGGAISMWVDDIQKCDNLVVPNGEGWNGWGLQSGYLGLYGWARTQDYYIDWVKINETVVPNAEDPTITADPASQTVEAGSPANFSVTVATPDDGGTITYQWQSSTDGNNWNNIAGATTSSYALSSAEMSDNGKRFRCAVTNTLGAKATTVNSAVAVLTVSAGNSTPNITAEPVDQTIAVGTDATFTVEATVGSGTIAYLWQASANNGTSWSNAAGTNSNASYTVASTTSNNGTKYRCRLVANGQTVYSAIATLRAGTFPASAAYTTFAEGDMQLQNWVTKTGGTVSTTGGVAPAVVYDPSAMDEKALLIRATSSTDRIVCNDLPSDIVDFEYAMRVKATRPTVDQGTAEVRFGMVWGVTGGNWNELTRSGSGWYPEVQGQSSWPSAGSAGVFTPGRWHTMRVVKTGKRVTLWFDGVMVVDNYEHSLYNLEAGKIGLRSFYTTQDVYIDSLYIGPVRDEENLPEEFAVITPRPAPFPYNTTYDDEETGTWIDANTYASYPTTIVTADGAADNKALKLDFAKANTMVVDTESSYTTDGNLKIRFKSVPTTPIKHEYDPINYPGEYVDTCGNLGFVVRYDSSTTYAMIYYDAATSTWQVRDGNSMTLKRGEIGVGPVMAPDKWYTLRLRYVDKLIKVWVHDGTEETLVGSFVNSAVSYPTVAGLIGVGSIDDAKTVYIDSINYTEYTGVKKPDPEPAADFKTIASGDMTVEMDNRFPAPRKYTIGGKTVNAQQDYKWTFEINGEDWLAEVNMFTTSPDTATYEVRAFEDKENSPNNYIDFKMTYKVEGTTLACEIKVMGETNAKLYTFDMAGVSLAKFVGAAGTNPVNGNIKVDGVVNPGTWNNMSDLMFDLGAGSPGVYPFTTGFVTNTGVNTAVGLINDCADTPTRNMVTFVGDDASDPMNVIPRYVTLTNGFWTYRGAKNSAEFPNAEADFPPPASMNFRVVLAQDNNASGGVNWQDVANVYRQYAPVAKGGNEIRDYFSYVSFNFNSLAQNPFLRGLDDGKRLYNFTDGFGQMILEKGFAAEGHDDSHPDVGNHIGIRQGGVKDFNTLINEGEKYNLKIGVHVNVGEYMLDAFFNPPIEYFYRDANGYPNSGGWGWVDQAFYFDQTKDLVSQKLEERFAMLKENAPGLDWIYVDIYSGADWRAKQVSKVLNDNGWWNATEFSGPMEQDVIWTHWGTDLYYPTSGDGTKIFRYLYNDTKDAFPTTSPAVSSMLRGSVQPGLSSWQNRTNMKEGVATFYNQNLPSKYMQYFPIVRWEDSQVTFGAPKDDAGVVQTAMAGAKSVLSASDTKIYAPDGTLVAIMDYVISGGKIKLKDDYSGLLSQVSQVFVPWNPITEEKIYYWNGKTAAARTTTWTLPTSWGSPATVQLFKLTDTGKVLINDSFPVSGNTVDLSSLDSSTPYVLYKNGATPLAAADDFGAFEVGGNYLADNGFDTHSFDAWETATQANVTMKNDTRWNGVMEVGSAASVITNEVEGLTPGKTYTALIWAQIGSTAADTRSVTLKVTNADDTGAVSKTINKTAVLNLDEPGKWKANTVGQPYPRMSRIEVRFTANSDGKAKFIVDVAAGTPVVTFDDARVWENPGKTVKPAGAYYYEDFENIAEGYGPFAYAFANGGNHTHLAQKAPATVNGHETNQIENYVINGEWSLKTYESKLDGNGNEIAIPEMIRTVPSELQFQPGKEYTVSFKYTTAINKYHAKVINKSGTVVESKDFPVVTDKSAPGIMTFTFTTPADDSDYYIAIAPSSPPGSLHKNYLVIDDFLVIEKVDGVETPNITTQPVGANYQLAATAAAMSVQAAVTDGGTLSYQWYANTTNFNIGGTPVGTNSASFTPPTATAGTTYYYCVVTNTKSGNSVSATSNTATVFVSSGQNHTITWTDSVGGTPAPTQTAVVDGGSIAEPATMGKTGYGFVGWFSDAARTVPVSFPVNNVTSAKTFYAKWTVNVTWEADGGTPVPTQTSVALNGTINAPAKMNKSGYAFAGWYSDAAKTQEVTFPVTNVTTPKTFYAKWTDSSTTITVAPVALNLTAQVEGYTTAPTLTVTITNSGSNLLSNLVLTPASTDNFTVGAPDKTSLAAGEVATFVITAKLGLLGSATQYTTDLSIAATGLSAPVVKTMGIRVNKYDFSVDTTSPYDFGTLAAGYTAPAAKTVTITNTGTWLSVNFRPATGAYVTGDTSAFTISAVTGTPNPGQTATFTVQPNAGQAPGTYSVTYNLQATAVGSPIKPMTFTYTVMQPVTNITEVPTEEEAGTPLTLSGTVVPTNATNKTITWSLKNAGTTGATLSGNTLNTTAAGTVVVTATVVNGLATGTNYVQDFNITITPKPATTVPVTWNANGGKPVPTQTSVPIGGTINAPAAMTKTGNVFGGWYTESTFKNKVTFPVTNVQTAKTYYAKWTAITTRVIVTGGKYTIVPNANGTITFNFQPNAGNGVLSVTVDGLPVKAQTSYTTAAGVIPGTINVCCGSTTVHKCHAFTDRNVLPWFTEDICYVAERGYFGGKTKTTFDPKGSMTRGMFITVLARVYGIKEADYPTSVFTDVESDDYFCAPSAWGKETGIVGGIGNDLFAPDRTINREEMVTFLYRYAKYAKADTSASKALTGFSDGDQVTGFAQPAMKWAVASGIIGGSNGKINPKGTATRGEVAAVVTRFCKLLGK